MKPATAVLYLCLCAPALLPGQAGGDIDGRVREPHGRRPGIEGARVTLDSSTIVAVTDLKGRYRFHAIPPGSHTLSVDAPGYAPAQADTVPVLGDVTTRQDFFLTADTAGHSPRPPSPIIDPMRLDDRQRLSQDELRDLPVSTVAEAMGLLNSVAGESYFGGRPGEQVAVVGGVPLRNAYDASTAGPGLILPFDVIQDLTLGADALSLYRTGALSGVFSIDPRQGGDRWTGTARYEGDRFLTGPTDQGNDRIRLQASGAFGGGIRLAAAVDGLGRLQVQPHGAPAGDPLAPLPWELPHNSGDQVSGAMTLTTPFGALGQAQLLAAHSLTQYEMFAPTYKYAVGPEPGRSMSATLLAVTARLVKSPRLSESASLSYFTRDFEQGVLAAPPPRGLGALTFSRYSFAGDALARGLDTAAARSSVPGYADAFLSTQTPWGVPEFGQGNDPRGDLTWNSTHELRADLGLDHAGDGVNAIGADVGVALSHASAFQRVLAYLAVADSVPPATAVELSTVGFHVGGRLQTGLGSGVLMAAVRLEGLVPGASVGGGVRFGVSPAIRLLVPVGTVTLSIETAQLEQFPDLQFLGAQAFNDSLESGHFRHAGQDLGYEVSRRFSIGLRSRFAHGSTSARAFGAKLWNLAASVAVPGNPDSSRFANVGSGEVVGFDIRVERSLGPSANIQVGYSFETTTYDAGTAYRLVGPSAPLDQDRSHHVVVIIRGALPLGVQGGAVGQYASGFPYTAVGASSLNGARAPSQMTLDILLHREFRLAGRPATVYVDLRNVLDRANLLAVRRDNGQAGIGTAGATSLAAAGYQADSTPIPYESPYYQTSRDLNGNGRIDGQAELLPLYEEAAADFGSPLAAYAAPRGVRLGLELSF